MWIILTHHLGNRTWFPWKYPQTQNLTFLICKMVNPFYYPILQWIGKRKYVVFFELGYLTAWIWKVDIVLFRRGAWGIHSRWELGSFGSLKIWRRGKILKEMSDDPHKSICFQIWLEYYIPNLFISVWLHERTTSHSPKVFVTKVCLNHIYWIRNFRMNILWQAL